MAVCALVPVVRLPGTWNVGPTVQHGQQEVAALHVGNADDPGLLAHVEPGGGVQRVGIRRGDVAELCVRVGARAHELAIGPRFALGLLDVGHDAARHLHRHQRASRTPQASGRIRGGLGLLGQVLGRLGCRLGRGLRVGSRRPPPFRSSLPACRRPPARADSHRRQHALQTSSVLHCRPPE